MVLALAGDSTMTSEVEPAGASGVSSSSGSTATERPRRFVAALPVALALFVARFLLVVLFFLTAMLSVPSDCRPAIARPRCRCPRGACEDRLR